jgi:hypothetical protein
MWPLVFLIPANKLAFIRYAFIALLTLLYLYLGTPGSDEDTYQYYFNHSCNGGRILGELEPLFQLYNRSFGYFQLCGLGAEISLFIFYLLFLKLAYPPLRRCLSPQDTFSVLFLLTYYIVSYQLAHNYRTGMASMLSILAFFSASQSKIRSLLYSILAIGFHIQVLPVLTIFAIFTTTGRARMFIILPIGLLAFLNFDYLVIFAFEQGLKYLRELSGTYRLSGIPFLLLYIFVITNIHRVKVPHMKPIYYFGFSVNIIFFFNAHLSSRLSRVVEPLLIVGLYFALQGNRNKFSAPLRILICLMPGLFFFAVERIVLI